MSEATWIEASAEMLAGEFERVMSERAGSFAELEAAAMAVANAMVRMCTKSKLEQMASRYGDEVLVDDQLYRRHATGTRRYHTLCGAVEVRRDTYRLVGVHNGPTVVPLELEAGIVENATPALARSVLQAFATMPLRHYEDEMRAAHRTVPSRSTLERIAKRVGTVIHEQLPLIEPALRVRESLPDRARSISVGVDRTTIPMAEPQAPLPEYWYRKCKRRPPPPITVAYRMAYVTTIAIHDADGETIRSTRVAATAEEGPVEMMERLGAELERLLEQRPELPVLVVQDGAPELWNLVEEWFANFGILVEMKIIDRYHLDERLAAIAEVLERDQSARSRLRDEWRRSLDRSDTAIKRICAQIESRIYAPPQKRDHGAEASPGVDPFGGRDFSGFAERTPRLSAESMRTIEGHLHYCDNHRDKMRYATPRKRGFPIGSGVTEGACKSVIAVRFKRSGQRWFEAGASACLQLRTLHLNERLEPAIRLYLELSRRELRFN